MRTSALVLAAGLAALLLAAPVARAEDEEYDDAYGDDEDAGADAGVSGAVVALTSADFEDTIAKYDFALVEFYAPWCGHCKALEPEYALAAKTLAETHPEVLIAKVDATEEEELAAQFEVEGFPTLKWFVHGEAKDGSGAGRSSAEIVAFVEKKTGPAVTGVSSATEAAAFVEDNKAYVAAFLKSAEGKEADEFGSAALNLEDVKFASTMDAAAAKALGITGSAPSVLLVTSDGEKKPYKGALESDALTEFVKAERIPAVVPFQEENMELIFNSGINKHILGFHSTDTEDQIVPAMKAASPDSKGKAIFVSVNVDEEGASGVLEFFGLTADDADGVVMGFASPEDDEVAAPKKYRCEHTKPTAAQLKKFTTAVIDGTAAPFTKSEEPPTTNDGPVTVVVGTTFEEIVLDENKDVLIELYAPWCGHCKKLAPVYEKLGKRFASIPSVVIAKIDATANENESMPEIEGYPSIFLYPAGSNDPVKFEEDNTLKQLTKFIKKHAKIPYELPKKGDKADDAKEL